MSEANRAYFERVKAVGLLPKTEEVRELLKGLGLEDLLDDNN